MIIFFKKKNIIHVYDLHDLTKIYIHVYLKKKRASIII